MPGVCTQVLVETCDECTSMLCLCLQVRLVQEEISKHNSLIRETQEKLNLDEQTLSKTGNSTTSTVATLPIPALEYESISDSDPCDQTDSRNTRVPATDRVRHGGRESVDTLAVPKLGRGIEPVSDAEDMPESTVHGATLAYPSKSEKGPSPDEDAGHKVLSREEDANSSETLPAVTVMATPSLWTCSAPPAARPGNVLDLECDEEEEIDVVGAPVLPPVGGGEEGASVRHTTEDRAPLDKQSEETVDLDISEVFSGSLTNAFGLKVDGVCSVDPEAPSLAQLQNLSAALSRLGQLTRSDGGSLLPGLSEEAIGNVIDEVLSKTLAGQQVDENSAFLETMLRPLSDSTKEVMPPPPSSQGLSTALDTVWKDHSYCTYKETTPNSLDVTGGVCSDASTEAVSGIVEPSTCSSISPALMPSDGPFSDLDNQGAQETTSLQRVKSNSLNLKLPCSAADEAKPSDTCKETDGRRHGASKRKCNAPKHVLVGKVQSRSVAVSKAIPSGSSGTKLAKHVQGSKRKSGKPKRLRRRAQSHDTVSSLLSSTLEQTLHSAISSQLAALISPGSASRVISWLQESSSLDVNPSCLRSPEELNAIPVQTSSDGGVQSLRSPVIPVCLSALKSTISRGIETATTVVASQSSTTSTSMASSTSHTAVMGESGQTRITSSSQGKKTTKEVQHRRVQPVSSTTARGPSTRVSADGIGTALSNSGGVGVHTVPETLTINAIQQPISSVVVPHRDVSAKASNLQIALPDSVSQEQATQPPLTSPVAVVFPVMSLASRLRPLGNTAQLANICMCLLPYAQVTVSDTVAHSQYRALPAPPDVIVSTRPNVLPVVHAPTTSDSAVVKASPYTLATAVRCDDTQAGLEAPTSSSGLSLGRSALPSPKVVADPSQSYPTSSARTCNLQGTDTSKPSNTISSVAKPAPRSSDHTQSAALPKPNITMLSETTFPIDSPDALFENASERSSYHVPAFVSLEIDPSALDTEATAMLERMHSECSLQATEKVHVCSSKTGSLSLEGGPLDNVPVVVTTSQSPLSAELIPVASVHELTTDPPVSHVETPTPQPLAVTTELSAAVSADITSGWISQSPKGLPGTRREDAKQSEVLRESFGISVSSSVTETLCGCQTTTTAVGRAATAPATFGTAVCNTTASGTGPISVPSQSMDPAGVVSLSRPVHVKESRKNTLEEQQCETSDPQRKRKCEALHVQSQDATIRRSSSDPATKSVVASSSSSPGLSSSMAQSKLKGFSSQVQHLQGVIHRLEQRRKVVPKQGQASDTVVLSVSAAGTAPGGKVEEVSVAAAKPDSISSSGRRPSALESAVHVSTPETVQVSKEGVTARQQSAAKSSVPLGPGSAGLKKRRGLDMPPKALPAAKQPKLDEEGQHGGQEGAVSRRHDAILISTLKELGVKVTPEQLEHLYRYPPKLEVTSGSSEPPCPLSGLGIDGMLKATSKDIKFTVPESVLSSVEKLERQKDENTGSSGTLRDVDGYTPYSSSLLCFRSYRLSPFYRTHARLPISSISMSNKIDPHQIMCRYELHGICNDAKCSAQHVRDVGLSKQELVEDLICYSPTLAGCSPNDLRSVDRSTPDLRHELSRKLRSYSSNLIQTYSGKFTDEQLYILAVHQVNQERMKRNTQVPRSFINNQEWHWLLREERRVGLKGRQGVGWGGDQGQSAETTSGAESSGLPAMDAVEGVGESQLR